MYQIIIKIGEYDIIKWHHEDRLRYVYSMISVC